MPRRRSGGPTGCPSRRIAPLVGGLEAADHAHERGLAAAGRPEEDDELVPARSARSKGRRDHRQRSPNCLVTRSKTR